jgi:hypothetical protein
MWKKDSDEGSWSNCATSSLCSMAAPAGFLPSTMDRALKSLPTADPLSCSQSPWQNHLMPILPLHAPGSMGRPATRHQQRHLSPSTTTKRPSSLGPICQLLTKHLPHSDCIWLSLSTPSILRRRGAPSVSSQPTHGGVQQLGSSMNLDKEPQAESDVCTRCRGARVGQPSLGYWSWNSKGGNWGCSQANAPERASIMPPTAHFHCDVRVHLHGYGHVWTSSSSLGGNLSIGLVYGAFRCRYSY